MAGEKNIVKMLMGRGASLSDRAGGKDVLALAAENGHHALAAFLGEEMMKRVHASRMGLSDSVAAPRPFRLKKPGL